MSAIQEEADGPHDVVKVLIALHEGMDAMDVVGPLEALTWAQHDRANPGECAALRIPTTLQAHELTPPSRNEGM